MTRNKTIVILSSVWNGSHGRRIAVSRNLGSLAKTLAMALAICSSETVACTVVRFAQQGHLVVARNQDWPFGEGLAIVNQRGIQKSSLTPLKPLTWVSKYGNVSFVQFGHGIPFTGMNERGLTVDLLHLNEAGFPVELAEGVRSVNVLQWVQYQLDTAASVGEVLSSLESVQPMPVMANLEKVHYFVADANGDAAIIEFIGGEAHVQQGTEAFRCAIANSTWQESKRALDEGNARNFSEERYRMAVQSIQSMPPMNTNAKRMEYAFETLRRVSQAGYTQWSLVYEPQDRRIWIKTAAASNLRWIDLDELSFGPEAETRIIDINANHQGDLTAHLVPYTHEANQLLVENAFNRYMPPGIVRASVKLLVLNYPSTLIVARPNETQTAAGQ